MGVNEFLRTLAKYGDVHQEIGRLTAPGRFRSSEERTASPEWKNAWDRSAELMKEMLPEALAIELAKAQAQAEMDEEKIRELS